jgi:hypothetical protein
MDRHARHQIVGTVETAAHPAAALEDPAPDHGLAPMVFAVANHRRRIARLLEQLDDLRHHTGDTRVADLEPAMNDDAALLAQFAARLRRGDEVLRDVIAALQGRFD